MNILNSEKYKLKQIKQTQACPTCYGFGNILFRSHIDFPWNSTMGAEPKSAFRRPLKDLKLPVRIYLNLCRGMRKPYPTIADLLEYSQEECLTFNNIGLESLRQINQALSIYGLALK